MEFLHFIENKNRPFISEKGSFQVPDDNNGGVRGRGQTRVWVWR